MEPMGTNKSNDAKKNSHSSQKFLEVQKPFFKKVFGRRRPRDRQDGRRRSFWD